MISKKELLEETYNTLKPLRKLKSGLLVYNKPHFKNNLIHITTNISEITNRIKKGWSIYPGKYKFILQAPETVLCDLSEIYSNPTANPKEILALFQTLKSVDIQKFLNKFASTPHFKNLEVVLLEGIASNVEIRIVGSDRRVYDIPISLYRMLKKTNLWKAKLGELNDIIKTRELNIKSGEINRAKLKTQNFYNKLIKKYSIFGRVNISNRIVYGFWKDLPKNDIYIFIPKSGLKYTFGFIEEMGSDEQIMLWECHLSLDQTKELKIFNKDLRNRKIAIIDRSYSSNTLDYLKEKVVREGGCPLSIALFPKSKRAIQNSDYILFLDKFIPSKNIHFSKNWQEKLFIKIANNKS
jgi:hypothetical protein